jgi:hypothetical protein
MVDMTENEKAALEGASEVAGAYLEEIGETDPSKMSREAWLQFLAEIVIAFSNEMRRLESASSERQ